MPIPRRTRGDITTTQLNRTSSFDPGRQRRVYEQYVQENNPQWGSMGRNERELAIRQRGETIMAARQMRQQSEAAQRAFGTPQNISETSGRMADALRVSERRRRGRASTILTGSQGVTSSPLLGYRTLLGR